jgi:hypothetical protein
MIPPLVDAPAPHVVKSEEDCARTLLSQLKHDIFKAQDNLLTAKASQATQTNTNQAHTITFKAGDHVLLATKHRRREYMQKGDNHIAKFMPCYDSPYTITNAHPETSTYTLDLPNSPNIFPTFHISQPRPYHKNNATLFPTQELPGPGPVVMEDGQLETFIEKIINERNVGHGKR